MGLYKEYSTDIIPGAIDTIARRLPNANLGNADVFTVRLNEGGASTYTEPAAVIQTSTANVPTICHLAYELHQEPFCHREF